MQVRAWLDTHEQGGFSEETPYLVAGEELLALCALVAWRRPRILFEIGTNRGWTCAALATNSPEAARILTLDIEEMPLADAEVSRCFRDRGIVRLRADSSTFDFSPYHADFVFVDARHESPWVDRDTETALRMVRDGGLVVWHDYGPEHPDVVTCLDRLATKVSLCRIAGTSLVVYRGPPAVSRRRPSTKSGQIES